MAAIDAHTDDDFCIDTLLDNMSYSAVPEVKVIDIASGVRDLELKPDKAVLKVLAKALKKLSSSSADELDNTSIAEYFADVPRFFESDLFSFIEMTFGIKAEHKVKEFLERVEQLITYAPKAGLYDTLYYDFSVVSVLEDYLEENGVKILRNAELTGADIENNAVSAIHLIDDGTRMTIYLNKEDLVILNAGDPADNRSEGSFGECAPMIEDAPQSSVLWSDLASKDDSFGIPELFFEDPANSTEFSIVDNNGYLLKKICAFLGCKPDNGVSALFEASNWRMKLTSEPY
jgi:oleate hydratase